MSYATSKEDFYAVSVSRTLILLLVKNNNQEPHFICKKKIMTGKCNKEIRCLISHVNDITTAIII